MPQLQLSIDGQRDPEIFDDFVKAEKAIKLRVKQGKIADSADIRIVTVAKPKPDTASVDPVVVPFPQTKVVREVFVRAPSHNFVFSVWGVICLCSGIALGALLF